MANTIKYEPAKSNSAKGSSHVKNYGRSTYATKKTETARETLLNFPVPKIDLKN